MSVSFDTERRGFAASDENKISLNIPRSPILVASIEELVDAKLILTTMSLASGGAKDIGNTCDVAPVSRMA